MMTPTRRQAGIARERGLAHRRGLARRNGFVLPVVILLVVMVGVVTSIMLQRHIARSKTVERQLRAYQEHHGARSLQTVIEAWLKTPTAQPRGIADILEPDGLALTVEPGDGTSVSVYLFPGQGTMLNRVSGLEGDDLAAAQLALQILRAAVRDDDEFQIRTRPAGPIAVDVNTASPEVLSAIVQAVLGDSLGSDRYETALLDARLGESEITLQTLSNIATEASVEADKRTRLGRFLTISPDLWEFRIDMYGSAIVGRPLLSRYRGLLVLGGGTSAGGSIFDQPPPFLSWEPVNLDEPLPVE